jgi:hypothetical protein
MLYNTLRLLISLPPKLVSTSVLTIRQAHDHEAAEVSIY